MAVRRTKLRLCAGISSSSQRDEQRQSTVRIINIINFIQQRFGAGRSMNTATAASPVRCTSPFNGLHSGEKL